MSLSSFSDLDELQIEVTSPAQITTRSNNSSTCSGMEAVTCLRSETNRTHERGEGRSREKGERGGEGEGGGGGGGGGGRGQEGRVKMMGAGGGGGQGGGVKMMGAGIEGAGGAY